MMEQLWLVFGIDEVERMPNITKFDSSKFQIWLISKQIIQYEWI